MSDPTPQPGHRHQGPSYGTRIFKRAGSKISGNGSWRLRSLEAGRLVVGKVDPIMRFCFAMEIRELARLLSSNKDELQRMKKGQVSTSRGARSLVIDKLGDQAGGQEVTVGCLYFDLAAQNEQSPLNMLGAVLRQVESGLEEVPGEIAQASKTQKQVIDGRGPQLADIVKMLQNTASMKPTFISIISMH